jgi:hypothetical protein
VKETRQKENKQRDALRDENTICQTRLSLLGMKMPGLTPGIFVSSACLNCLPERCQRTGEIPAY